MIAAARTYEEVKDVPGGKGGWVRLNLGVSNGGAPERALAPALLNNLNACDLAHEGSLGGIPPPLTGSRDSSVTMSERAATGKAGKRGPPLAQAPRLQGIFIGARTLTEDGGRAVNWLLFLPPSSWPRDKGGLGAEISKGRPRSPWACVGGPDPHSNRLPPLEWGSQIRRKVLI